MHVCVVTRELAGVTDYTGGVGTHFNALVHALLASGDQVTVLLVDQETSPEEHQFGSAGFVAVPSPRMGPIWFLNGLPLAYSVRTALKRIDADVVFAPEWAGDVALAAGAVGVPPVVTNLVTSQELIAEVEGNPALDWRWRWRYLIQRRLERRQVARSRALFACSNAILDWTKEHWQVPSDTVVMPNFIDVRAVQARAGQAAPAPLDDGVTVLYFGRLETRKGVHVLAEAMHRVLAQRDDVRFLYVGQDGRHEGRSMQAFIEGQAEHHDDRLSVIHALPPADMAAVVARADITVLPSLWENFSIAALETKALGRPLIATTGSGFDDFCTDGQDSLLVEPGSVDQIEHALLRLVDDPALRERLGSRAREVVERYDSDVVVEQLRDELQKRLR